jgi:hypothetical protein
VFFLVVLSVYIKSNYLNHIVNVFKKPPPPHIPAAHQTKARTATWILLKNAAT